MYYNSNKANKASNSYNIKNFIENIPQTKEQSTISILPKNTINTKTDNFNLNENSENTINNINPLSKSKDSKDSNSNLYSSIQYNLFTAVECNDLEKAANIMKNNPSQIDSLNDEGLSPLHIAVIKGNIKMIDLLLKNGANSNILSEKNKHTPMHLACLNQNSMTEEIIQELRNFNANENICDANNKKPLDYLNKKDSNEGESSAEKKQAVSNTNTIMVITNENHFDSFMTSNKEEDNKSNVNSTINNNTIQTPTKMEEGNNNENDNNVYDYNNEPTITINSNNKYNTNNTINSKSDSVNRRQYTFGREEDFYKFQNNNDNNNQSNNNKNINNNKKDLDINFNNINDENGKESNILLQRII
jgi:ankyrin repeat protein